MTSNGICHALHTARDHRPVSDDAEGHGHFGYSDYGVCVLQGSDADSEHPAASLLKGVLVFLAALMLSMVLNMNSINFIMNQLVRWGVVAPDRPLPARDPTHPGGGGQPPLHRLLLPGGGRHRRGTGHRPDGAGLHRDVPVPHRRLIVFERENLLDDMVRSGTVLDAAVSSELLKNIFFVKAPMHDGASSSGTGGCLAPDACCLSART